MKHSTGLLSILLLGLGLSWTAWGASGVGDGAGGAGRAATILSRDWTDLAAMDKNHEIEVRWPKLGEFPLSALCVSGGWLRTAEEVEVCTEWKEVSRRGNLYDGRKFECVSKEVRFEYLAPGVSVPGAFDVDIYTAIRWHDWDSRLLGTKPYSLPVCR